SPDHGAPPAVPTPTRPTRATTTSNTTCTSCATPTRRGSRARSPRRILPPCLQIPSSRRCSRVRSPTSARSSRPSLRRRNRRRTRPTPPPTATRCTADLPAGAVVPRYRVDQGVVQTPHRRDQEVRLVDGADLHAGADVGGL